MNFSAFYRSMVFVIVGWASVAVAAQIPAGDEYTNTIGMKFVRIEPGARYRGDRGWILENQQVSLSSVPTSAGIKFIWNEPNRQWRIYYSLDPYSPPDIELPQSKAGLYFGKPLTESTTIYILMSNGRIDIDHFEITPIDS